MQQPPIKSIYQGKTPAEIAKIKAELAMKAQKMAEDRKKAAAKEPLNEEGRTASQEREYMKAMEENSAEVRKIDERLKAGRLANAMRTVNKAKSIKQ